MVRKLKAWLRPLARRQRFLADKKGVAAVEFALSLPLMLILMIGSAETTEALNYKRKVDQLAISVADLVSQAESITRNELSDVMLASSLIMAPFQTTDLDVIVASVEFDQRGQAKVDWSYDKNGGTPWPKGTPPPLAIPRGMNSPNTTLIVGKVDGTYIPTFAEMAQNLMPRATRIEMDGLYYVRPRFSTAVTMN